MNTHLECIPCFLSQSIEAAKMVTDDISIQEKVVKEVMKDLQNISFDKTPPEISTIVHRKIKEITGCNDPYLDVKLKENNYALKLENKLRYWVDSSENRLFTAIKLSVAGNIIDFGTPTRINIDTILGKINETNFLINNWKIFQKKLNETNRILYLGDNTGEIVFDKILIEELVKLGKEVTFVVREKPIINDATLEDAKYVGLDKIVKVITGVKESPGTVLELCSEGFLEEFNNAELIISKGQGNYESLNNENVNIFFLLIAKCKLVAKDLDVNIGNMIFKYGGNNDNRSIRI